MESVDQANILKAAVEHHGAGLADAADLGCQRAEPAA